MTIYWFVDDEAEASFTRLINMLIQEFTRPAITLVCPPHWKESIIEPDGRFADCLEGFNILYQDEDKLYIRVFIEEVCMLHYYIQLAPKEFSVA